MTQVFPRWFDTVVRAAIVGGLLAFAGTALGIAGFYRSDYVTREHVPYLQPVPFSHEHHVSRLGIDCRYCHTTVETQAFAGLPPTETCMNCHQQIWVGADTLAQVRRSWQTGEPLRWHRVNSVPGFVYFHHGIHVQKGVGCVECHGRVDRMPLTWQDKPMTMGWCLSCHRDPGPHLRPRSEVFSMNWSPTGTHEAITGEPPRSRDLGRRLAEEYQVKDAHALTSCSTCHR